jgi:hypothetical protein
VLVGYPEVKASVVGTSPPALVRDYLMTPQEQRRLVEEEGGVGLGAGGERVTRFRMMMVVANTTVAKVGA